MVLMLVVKYDNFRKKKAVMPINCYLATLLGHPVFYYTRTDRAGQDRGFDVKFTRSVPF